MIGDQASGPPPDDTRELEQLAFGRIGGWAAAAIAAGLPTLAAILRATVLAHGDPQVTRAILADINIGAYLAALVADVLASGLVVLVVLGVGLWHLRIVRDAPDATRQIIAVSYVAGLCITAALTWSTGGSLLLPIGLVLLGTFVLTLSERSASAFGGARSQRWLLGCTYVGIPAVILLRLVTGLQWLPLYAVQMMGGEVTWGQVLSESDLDIQLLLDNGALVNIPNDNIRTRAICPESTLYREGLSYLSSNQVSRDFGQEPVPELGICAERSAEKPG